MFTLQITQEEPEQDFVEQTKSNLNSYKKEYLIYGIAS